MNGTPSLLSNTLIICQQNLWKYLQAQSAFISHVNHFDHCTYTHLCQFSLGHLRPITFCHRECLISQGCHYWIPNQCALHRDYVCDPHWVYSRHLHAISINTQCLPLAIISNSLQQWSQQALDFTDFLRSCINARIWPYWIISSLKRVSFATTFAYSNDCYPQPWEYCMTWHQEGLKACPCWTN